MDITLRVRTQLGIWRVKDVPSTLKMSELRSRVESEHYTDCEGRAFTGDAEGKMVFLDEQTVSEVGLKHGDFVHILVDEEKTGIHEESQLGTRTIKNGNIIAKDYEAVSSTNGFRPGMQPLRNIKKQWTLNEFIAMDSQFEYKISRPEKAMCSGVEIDQNSLSNFQNYVYNALDLQQMRVGYLYGYYVDKSAHEFEDKSIDSLKVEFIYEPPQNNTDETFEILEDPQQVTIDALCEQLKVVKVGWIFAHPLREKGFHFSNLEILEAAEQQLIAAEGVNETPFITMKVTLNPETNELLAEAWQVSKLCMEMAAEGAIEPNSQPGSCRVNDTFTAYVEGKPNKEIDNNLFLNLVPVKGCTSDLFISDFPRNNRIGVTQSREDLKKQISKADTKGWKLQQLLGDFQLLLYLTQFLDLKSDLVPICNAILSPDKSIPITEGHALIIRSLAGMS